MSFQLFYNFILEPVLTTLIISYCLPELSLIGRLFTQESVCTSKRFLLNHMSLPIKNSESEALPKYAFLGSGVFIYYFI